MLKFVQALLKRLSSVLVTKTLTLVAGKLERAKNIVQ